MPIAAQPTRSSSPTVRRVEQSRYSTEVDGGAKPATVRPESGCFTAPGAAACDHCGAAAGSGAIRAAEHTFCCVGCQAVYTLLHEHGLGQFYQLASTPNPRPSPQGNRFAWLNDPVVSGRLLDFRDGRHARVTLQLPAIHCAACVWLLERLFQLHPGIGESRVNFTRREAMIAFVPEQIGLAGLAELLATIGYEPEFTYADSDGAEVAVKSGRRRRQWLQVGVAGFGFGNIMLLALPGYLGLDSASGPWFARLAGGLGLVLALPVLIYSAGDYWRAAGRSLRRRILTLEVPIAVGLAAIYGQSLYEVLSGRGSGYCDSLTGLIFFLLCGRAFQQQTVERLAFDRDYKGFFPLAALRKTAAGEEAVAISRLAVGDRLVIRHGELIPADSVLVQGTGSLDYSFVTGESEPITRSAGEFIYAGGRQTGGAIEVETVKAVSESYLTSLWNHEAFRKDRDDPARTLTNRYSPRFTLVVLLIAVGAGGYWSRIDTAVAMKAFISVLIVACPCALALAAPLTLGTAQRILAGQRIFFRNSNVIERLSEIDAVVLDKTGTLTVPAREIGFEGGGLSPAEAGCVGALARHSTHPHAQRIAAQCAGQGDEPPEISEYREQSGSGLSGLVQGERWILGSRTWLAENGVVVPGDPAPAGGASWLARDGVYLGKFIVNQVLRPEVETLIQSLRGRFSLSLLSGDNARESARFQTLLGPESEVTFNQSPLDKLEAIRARQNAGHRVLMVGDGLNDAGALRQSDVGIAVVERVGIFSPASDVILPAAQLPELARVLVFSKQVAGLVRAGFVVSSLYNVVGLSIAATGALSPLVCAVLMPVSSASVVAFAVLTTRFFGRQAFRPAPGRNRPARAARPPGWSTPMAREAGV